MLNSLLKKYLLNTIINSLKGKKRWLVILALALANLLQSQGVELTDFVDALGAILNTSEG